MRPVLNLTSVNEILRRADPGPSDGMGLTFPAAPRSWPAMTPEASPTQHVPHGCCALASRRLLFGTFLLGTSLLGGCVPASPYASVTVDRSAERHAAENPASLDRIGTAALRANDNATASSFFNRALSLEPGDETAALGAAQAATQAGHVDEALDILRGAARHADGAAQVSLDAALGKLLVIDHRPAEAETVFQAGLRNEPDSVKLLTGLGVALDGQRRFAEAGKSFHDALALAPDDLPARNDLALTTALAGDPDAALHDLQAIRTSAEGTGSNETALHTIDGNIALVRAMQGDLSGAEAADARAADGADPTRNAAFYSRLAGDQSLPGDQSLGAKSGLAPAGAAAAPD